jgi:hypothetical protein
LLIVVYSGIDTFGLLVAPDTGAAPPIAYKEATLSGNTASVAILSRAFWQAAL